MARILHITKRGQWEQAKEDGCYEASSLKKQGFTHCSTANQVIRVANFLFAGQQGLVLLVIEEASVKPEVRYENLEGGEELFPHIYGPLNLDAVVDVVDFPPQPDGQFVLPPGLTDDCSIE